MTGIEPTGTVSFTANGTSLGTAQISSGAATLQTSFADAGSYTVTSAYTGDPNNSPSTSNSVAVTIAVPDFKISAQPSSATISPGQSATFTFTVTPSAGHDGTVSFSCGALPAAGDLFVFSRQRDPNQWCGGHDDTDHRNDGRYNLHVEFR